VRDELVLNRWSVASTRERNRQQPWGFVHDDDGVILVHDRKLAGPRGPRAAPVRGAGSIHPHADVVAQDQVTAGVRGCGFGVVHEDLSAVQSSQNLPSRTQPVIGRQKLIEPQTRRRGVDVPHPIVRHTRNAKPELQLSALQLSDRLSRAPEKPGAEGLKAMQRHRSVAQLWHLASAQPPVRVMRASMFFDRIRSTIH